jgi:tetratricopeptide (TPR) repeat protein
MRQTGLKISLPVSISELGAKFSLASLLPFLRPKTAQMFYNMAVDLYNAGEYERALAELVLAEERNPGLSYIFYNKALCLQQLGRTEEAKEAFQASLALDPDDPDTLYNLARLFYTEDDLDVAMAYLEQARELVETQGGDDLVCYLLALIYEQQGDIEQAIEFYEKALLLNSEHLLSGIFLSKLYVKRQEYQRAIELLRDLAEKDPNNLDVNYELSLCLAKVGEWEDTIRYCRRVIEIDPNYTKAYNQLGLALYCTERLEEAVESYEKALKIDPSYATALNNLAYTYEKMQNYEKAVDKFTEYLAFRSGNAEERTEIEEHITLLRRKALE